jgi:hypothetical protein
MSSGNAEKRAMAEADRTKGGEQFGVWASRATEEL